VAGVGVDVDHGLELGDYFAAWFDSLPAAQLAADLGITVAGSKSLANRARETLRRSALARAA
jgi:DNA-directed RNA polymerase specialized sigma24 family protein